MDWVFYGDTLSSQAGFAKGDVDHIAGGSKATNDTIKKLNSKAREESWIFGNWNHIRFNTKKPPFDDARVRLALFKLMNYTTWNDDYYGSGKWDYTGPLSAAFTNDAISSDEIKKAAGYNPDTRAADIKAGKDALAAAGFPNGKGLDFKIMPFQPTGVQYEMAVRAQDDLKSSMPEAKVELDVPADTTIFSRRQIGGDFDVISYTLFPAPDAVIEMTNNYQSKGARNYGKYNNPQMDALIEKASTQLDQKERAATLKEAQKLLLEKEMPTVLYGMPRQITYFQPRVKGMEKYASRIGGGGYDTYNNLRNAWLDG